MIGSSSRRPFSRRAEYTAAVGIVALTTLVALALRSRLAAIDVAMLYLLAVVMVSSRCARAPALLATALSVACFDFFFVLPYGTFNVGDRAYWLTFAMMFVVAMTMGRLTAAAREQAEVAQMRERRMATLYGMNRALAAVSDTSAIAEIIATHLGKAADGHATVVMDPDASEIALWDDETIVLALRSPTERFGLVGISAMSRPLDEEDRHLLDLLAGQAGQALERVTLARRSEVARLAMEAERLRTALLSSLSHDLRTPLGTIEVAATALLADSQRLSVETIGDLAGTIVEEVHRMGRLVANLLDMVRLESGTLAVHRSWQPLEEAVGVALIRLDDRLRTRLVDVQLSADLPLVLIDEVLVEQLFVNLLDNALKYTPEGSPLLITARRIDGAVEVEVADRGPGIPPGQEEMVLRMFHRAQAGEDASKVAGSGLGLAICAGIVSAHGGTLRAEAREGGGAVFRFTLPLDAPPPSVPPAEITAASQGR